MTNDIDARATLSEMTDITGRTIDAALHRHSDLDALYRDCPTAFWLAPDGDGVLPAPLPGPMLPDAVAPDAALDQSDSATPHGLASGIFRALLIAGPTFAATGLMLNQTSLDRHWWDPFGRALLSLMAFPFTITIGALLALVPTLFGVLALGETGARFPVARRPAAWALTGGAMGLLIAAAADAGGMIGLALVITSIACARVARGAIDWAEPAYG